MRTGLLAGGQSLRGLVWGELIISCYVMAKCWVVEVEVEVEVEVDVPRQQCHCA